MTFSNKRTKLQTRLAAPLCAITILGASALAPAVSVPAHAATALTGAGSTFDFPFFDLARHHYSSVDLNYQAVGSGAGIQQFTQKLVDFGATDVPMNPTTELPAAEKAGGRVLQVPIALGGVSIAYSVKGIKNGLHLDGSTLANIFLGRVTKWNDSAIKKLNKGVKLPSTTITVVHRSDGSGTSNAFTDYLSKVSDQWRTVVGVSKTPNWPVGVGGKGNLGVAQLVEQTDGAIGYVELAYVLQNHMHEAMIQNRSHNFELPTLKTVAADAASFPKVSADQYSIANGKGKTAYPIATYSWVLLFQHQSDSAKGKALVKFLQWMATTAQSKYAKQLQYVPLPKKIQQLALSDLKKVK